MRTSRQQNSFLSVHSRDSVIYVWGISAIVIKRNISFFIVQKYKFEPTLNDQFSRVNQEFKFTLDFLRFYYT